MGISFAGLKAQGLPSVVSSPEAIQACVASLAAEAFDAGHSRAAQLLAQAAALLNQPDLWNRARPE